MPASRPLLCSPALHRLWRNVRANHDAEYELWVSRVRECDADSPLHGWRPSHRSGQMIDSRLLLQSAHAPSRDVVSRRKRRSNDVRDDLRHPAADRRFATPKPAGWNAWVNGDLSYLQINNSSSGFPNDPGIPISGSMGVDYHWANGWLVGAAVERAAILNSRFSTGGGFTQNEVALSFYTAFRNSDWWAESDRQRRPA